MKDTPSGLVFHPILPAYLVKDMVSAYEKCGDKDYLTHARHILNEALLHARPQGNALTFIYSPESGLSAMPHQFYSALTQSWYIRAICSLAKHDDTDLATPLARIFNSLLIPIDEGGVLIKKDYGWIIEEYPSAPPLYTLNGWMTALCSIISCRSELRRQGLKYEEFLHENLRALEQLLPLYDAGFCLNSRYQLTGFTRLRVVFDKPAPNCLKSFHIHIPGEGVFPGNLRKQGSYRWENFVERSEAKLLQLNIVQSLISHPEPNVFTGTFFASEKCKAKVFLADGGYRPDSTAMPTEGWRQVSEFALEADTEACIQIELPFDGKDLFAYPTNFKKQIKGRQFNAYHHIHIKDLALIYEYSGKEVFKEWALKWLSYKDKWPVNAPFNQGSLSLHPLNSSAEHFDSYIKRTLSKARPCDGQRRAG